MYEDRQYAASKEYTETIEKIRLKVDQINKVKEAEESAAKAKKRQ